MRPGGGKAKGASFERDICRQLSLWVSEGKQEDVFWRSAMSGGRSTVAHAKGKRLAAQAGDISCIHPVGQLFANKFFIECKDYRDLNFIGLVKGKGNLVQFWCEASVQAKRYNKEPFLVAHQARQPVVVCTTQKGINAAYGPYYEENNRIPAVLWAPRLDMHIILFDEFLKHDIPYNLRLTSD